jgi:hypothetical protein
MFYSQNISELRQFYLDSWVKYQKKETLSSLEEQICQVLENHPEYQKWLSEQHLETQFHHEIYGENPFLHMGLHLAIQEQIQMNRPSGIQEIYFEFIKKNPHLSHHDVEHIFMDVLAKTLWDAQQQQRPPDEQIYLLACKGLLSN